MALIDVRVMPSVRAMSAIRAADTIASSAKEAPPPTALTATMPRAAKTVRTSGLAAMPAGRPKRRRRGPASRDQEADRHAVHDRRVGGEEPGEFRRRRRTGPPRDRRPGSRRAGCRAPTGPGSRGSAPRTGSRAAAGARGDRPDRRRRPFDPAGDGRDPAGASARTAGRWPSERRERVLGERPSPAGGPPSARATSTSWPPSTPPSTAPIGKPAMILGKLALIPAMSRNRPACPPMNTKPSWIRIGNRTSSATDTQAPRRPGREEPGERRTRWRPPPSTDNRDAE